MERDKSGCLKCIRIFFLVCGVLGVVFSSIYILLFIINPTILLNDYEKPQGDISDAEARDILLVNTIWMAIGIPVTCFAIYALYKDNVKFLWITIAVDVVLTIGMFITGIHWIQLVPSLIGLFLFGCYVFALSNFQKSLRFDRNLRV